MSPEKNWDEPSVVNVSFSAEELDLVLSEVPEWVPSEYREFCEEYGEFFIPGVDWHSPDCPPSDPVSIQSAQRNIKEAAEALGDDPDTWFAVATFDGSDYAAYHLKDDGTTEFGRYHFEDGEFIAGPFPTMKDWMRTLVDGI